MAILPVIVLHTMQCKLIYTFSFYPFQLAQTLSLAMHKLKDSLSSTATMGFASSQAMINQNWCKKVVHWNFFVVLKQTQMQFQMYAKLYSLGEEQEIFSCYVL